MAGNSGRRPGCRLHLGGLLALLVSFPFLEDVARPLFLVMVVAGVFVAGVVAADGGPLHVRRAVAIAVFQIGSTALSLLIPSVAWIAVAVALFATAVLILFATYCVLHYVLRSRSITRDQIYAGISMYVMLGFAFGALFYMINILDPRSFTSSSAAPGTTPDLMYFSFVTLATLGYGDITPHTNIARSLAMLEALAGMVYIAVFMARLVSLRSTAAD